MKTMHEVLAIVASVVGVVCIFMDSFDLAAVAFAMAAYLQAVSNSKKSKP